MTEIKTRTPVPVRVGNVRLFCEKMKLSADTLLYESPTVTGYPAMTNKSRRMTRISFSGRVYDENAPMELAVFANDLNGSVEFTVYYRGMKFSHCAVTGVYAEDSGEDYITLTIEIATADPIIFTDEVI